jgi:hypothetical protein
MVGLTFPMQPQLEPELQVVGPGRNISRSDPHGQHSLSIVHVSNPIQGAEMPPTQLQTLREKQVMKSQSSIDIPTGQTGRIVAVLPS